MKSSSVATVLMLATAACITPFDAELHEGAPPRLRAVAPDAPALNYELIVIARSDEVGTTHDASLSERVGREVDELLREHGIRPTRLEATPVPGEWMRLTLTRGLDRIHLRAERWDADRFLGTEEHASPVHDVRGDVALLLDRLLKR